MTTFQRKLALRKQKERIKLTFLFDDIYQNQKGEFVDKHGRLFPLACEAQLLQSLANLRRFEQQSKEADLTVG